MEYATVKKGVMKLKISSLLQTIWNAAKGFPMMIGGTIGFLSACDSMKDILRLPPILWTIINWIAYNILPLLALDLLFIIIILAHNHIRDVEKLNATHSMYLNTICEEHDKECLILFNQYLDRIERIPVTSYLHYDTHEELTASGMQNVYPDQIVSIRFDINHGAYCSTKTIGYGIVMDFGKDYTIIRIIRKLEEYGNEWRLITDAAHYAHKEQLQCTTISGIITERTGR